MKKYLHTLLITILLLIVPITSLSSSWIDMGSYKEIQSGNSVIMQLLVPPNDSCFYTFDQANIFRKYNYNGDSIFGKKIIGNIDSLRCNNDAKTYNSYNQTLTVTSSFVGTKTLNAQIKNLINDSLLLSKDLYKGQYHYGPGNGYILNIFLDYNSIIKTLLFHCNFGYDESSGGIGEQHSIGSSLLYNKENDSINIFDVNGLISYCYDNNYKYFICRTFRSDYFQNDSITGFVKQEFKFYNLKNNRSFVLSSNYKDYANFDNNKYGFLPDWFRLANKDSVFLAIKDSTLYKYKFTQDTVLFVDTLALNYKFNNLIYSPDDKYYIVSSPNYTIDIYHIESKSLVKSYLLKDSILSNGMMITQDGKGFLTSNEQGKIKYFEPEFFSKKLQALFTSDMKISRPNKDIKFFSLSTGNPDSFYWDFGDGTNSTLSNPVHSYQNPGKYNVKLIVNKNTISDTLMVNNYIIVNPTLKAGFDADIVSGNPPLTVHFTDNSTGSILSRLWYFGDSDTSSEQSPTHTYLKSGIYPVSLIVFDGTFKDTLTRTDYIQVNQMQIGDTIFEKEKIIWTYNTNIQAIKGFEVVNGGYLIESLIKDKNYILRLDNNFDTLWSKSLYESRFHSPIQQTSDGTIYVVGNNKPDSTIFAINKFDEFGTKFYSKNYKFTYRNRIYDYLGFNNGYSIFTNDFYGYNILGAIHYEIIDKFDSVSIFRTYTLSLRDKGYCYSFKLTNDNLGKYSFLASYYYYNYGKLYNPLAFEKFDQNGLIVLNIDLGTNGTIKEIFDFKRVNNNCYLVINDNNMFSKIVIFEDNIKESGIQWAKNIPNCILKSILPLSNDRFVLSGSKDSCCWFAIMDTSGAILEEHKIAERYGSFNDVSKNKDGSFLFIGSLYKNSFVSGRNISKSNEKNIILSDSVATGIYMFKTKPSAYLSVKEAPINNFEINVYPNPANDMIVFSLQSPEPQPINLSIFNSLGNKIEQISLYVDSQKEISLNLDGLSSGFYYYNIQAGNYNKAGKFVVIK
jgi:PKD repeat protein